MTTDASRAPSVTSVENSDAGMSEAPVAKPGATDGRGANDDPARTSKDARNRKPFPVWLEGIVLVGAALVLAVVIKSFFVQPFYIPSESMEPGLIKNDRILVQKVSYWFGGTRRAVTSWSSRIPVDGSPSTSPAPRVWRRCCRRSGSTPPAGIW